MRIFVVALTLLACACATSDPFYEKAMFRQGGDHEEGPEIPCPDGRGGFVPMWHACHAPPLDRCCPDGYSCSQDDFMPRTAEPFCRWWGR